MPSTLSTTRPTTDSAIPTIIVMWVGLQSVTSWPNSRCQTSSSGKPSSATAAPAAVSTAPTGARQPSAMRTPERGTRSSPIAMPITPAAKAAKMPASRK